MSGTADNVKRREAPPGGLVRRISVPQGGTIRTAVWKPEIGEPRGTFILLHGRGEFIEKYHETIGDYLKRGWVVCTMDWRGQGLSSRFLSDSHKGHVENFMDYQADLDRFVEEVVMKAGPLPRIVMAHSFGALVTLHYLRRKPGIFTKAILLAPMLSLSISRYLSFSIIKAVLELICSLGFSKSYIPGRPDDYLATRPFADNRLTSDSDRFLDTRMWIKRNPELAVGGPTFGWLRAAFRSMETAAQPDFPGKITTPLLVLGATKDPVVGMEAQEQLAQKIRSALMIKINGAKHEILKERDELRDLALSLIDRFIVSDTERKPGGS